MRGMLLVLLLVVFAASCTPVRMDSEEFSFLCRSYDTPGGFGVMGCDSMDHLDICASFSQAFEEQAVDKAACLEHCSQTRHVLMPRHLTDACASVVQTGYIYCQRYCRDNFSPAGEPEFTGEPSP